MKFLLSLIFIFLIGSLVYYFCTNASRQNKKLRGLNKKAIGISGCVVIVLMGLLFLVIYRDATAPDTQCSTSHVTNSYPPSTLATAMDFFLQGNYEYDRGSCQKAITAYTSSIQLDPTYPEAYNNRAYTYMRMHLYQQALSDLDQAILLKPTYAQALMNRADIYNYYFQIDRTKAIADYERILALGGTQRKSVCGHLFLARHNGWNMGTIIGFPALLDSQCR